jgi:hypothetical protein
MATNNANMPQTQKPRQAREMDDVRCSDDTRDLLYAAEQVLTSTMKMRKAPESWFLY